MYEVCAWLTRLFQPEEIQYEKGLIVKITNITEEGAGREELKEALSVHGEVQVLTEPLTELSFIFHAILCL